MWINTKVEFEWDGNQYVETACEGYEYSGEVAECQFPLNLNFNPTGTGGYGNLPSWLGGGGQLSPVGTGIDVPGFAGLYGCMGLTPQQQ